MEEPIDAEAFPKLHIHLCKRKTRSSMADASNIKDSIPAKVCL